MVDCLFQKSYHTSKGHVQKRNQVFVNGLCEFHLFCLQLPSEYEAQSLVDLFKNCIPNRSCWKSVLPHSDSERSLRRRFCLCLAEASGILKQLT